MVEVYSLKIKGDEASKISVSKPFFINRIDLTGWFETSFLVQSQRYLVVVLGVYCDVTDTLLAQLGEQVVEQSITNPNSLKLRFHSKPSEMSSPRCPGANLIPQQFPR